MTETVRTEPTLDDLVDALSRMFMDERDPAHPWKNPVPSQIQRARMFVEAHVVPLAAQLASKDAEIARLEAENERLRGLTYGSALRDGLVIEVNESEETV